MDNNRSWSSIGKEIRDAVSEALETGNFRDLGDVVTETVTDTVADTVKNIGSKMEQAVSDLAGGNKTEQWINAAEERRRAAAAQRAGEAQIRIRAPFCRVGRVSSVLYKLFGGIGTMVFGLFLLSTAAGGGGWIAFCGISLFFLFFALMLGRGCAQAKRLKLAQKYLGIAGNNHYINIRDLSLYTGRPIKFVLKEVKKMLEAGHFPQGHLDLSESCLMLNDKIYREYLDLEKQRKLHEWEQNLAGPQGEVGRDFASSRGEGTAESQTGGSGVRDTAQSAAGEMGSAQRNAAGREQGAADTELDAMIAEGQEYIRKLRDLNDNIPGEEISAKLFRLENLLKEIFEALREHGELLAGMRKFMNYYLPTTIKLVEAYEEFDTRGVKSREVTEAKAEIEKTLDSINSAFEELLGRMFRTAAFDAAADAQVLQTMLAKDGLSRQYEFERV